MKKCEKKKEKGKIHVKDPFFTVIYFAMNSVANSST